MASFRLLKVQSPALAWQAGGRRWRFAAHTFLAAADPDGRIFCEHHGIARAPGGGTLRGPVSYTHLTLPTKRIV